MLPLREVLTYFQRQSGTVSLTLMARDLNIEQAMLQEMIDYWVRKGRLREIVPSQCTVCGEHGCPFVFALPRHYELVREEFRGEIPCQHCACH